MRQFAIFSGKGEETPLRHNLRTAQPKGVNSSCRTGIQVPVRRAGKDGVAAR
jgi:hypothetical protein